MFSLLAVAAIGCKSAPETPPPTTPPVEQPVVAEPEPEPEPEAAGPTDPDDVHIEGDHLVIDRHINFALNSHEILEDSFDLLDHMAQLLKNHPEITTLHVIGHTDAAGSADYNLKLSDKRAASVVEALRQRGITQNIDSKGKGKSEPVCKEDTDECHEKNRRVEFLIETK